MFSKLKTKNKNNVFCASNGFTFIEMVVAVSIFVVAMLIVADIFLMTSKAQRKSSAVVKAESEARYALEVISREIRSGLIDYTYYGGTISSPTEIIVLRDPKNNEIRFDLEKSAPSSCPTDSFPCIVMYTNEIPQGLSGKGLKVQTLNFYISPTADPFASDFDPAIGNQPRVTITMSLQSVSSAPENQATVFLQTTVSSRYYKR